MAYIYKITNTVNGKVYIGQTRYTVEWRWHTHLYATYNEIAGDHNTLLHKAIRKYGIDAFLVETIDECDSSELNDKEIFWIKHFNSYDSDYGYNMTLGGSGLNLYSDEEILKLWNAGYAASEIARLMNAPIGRNTVRSRLLGMGIDEDIIRKRGNEAISRSKHKLIYQYAMNGKYIKAFYSAVEAAKETKSNRTNINACAAGNLKSAGGYLWSYTKVDKMPKPKNNKGFTLVGKYTPDGSLIEAYVSLTAAQKHNEISRKRLAIACEKNEVYKGFLWKFLDIKGGVIHV